MVTDTAMVAASRSPGIEAYRNKTNEYVQRSKAENTLRAYRSDWADFSSWCASNGVESLSASPETVAAYIVCLVDQGRRYSTIARRIASISKAHQTAGFDSPTRTPLVRDALKGIARTIGTAKKQAKPLRIADIRRIAYGAQDTLSAKRDLALLLLGWSLAARRSELVSLDAEDVDMTDDGMRITLRRSKTDQVREGVVFGISQYDKDPHLCPVKALHIWLVSAEIKSGPLFRAVNRHGQVLTGRLSDKTVERIIRRHFPDCNGHSLRSGFITDQYAKGTPEAVIAERSRHKSWAVLGSYRREANLFSYDYMDGVV